jgi:hypothetical protein
MIQALLVLLTTSVCAENSSSALHIYKAYFPIVQILSIASFYILKISSR